MLRLRMQIIELIERCDPEMKFFAIDARARRFHVAFPQPDLHSIPLNLALVRAAPILALVITTVGIGILVN